ncbi:hypothetical protein V6N11_074432 [Hibiscus sabdariffa]|uniref:Uncharacterized protein n=1 Tax=Hibiscus sabdariffa TaxID=183260 RepID=A0ABR2R3P0_9ROSI
MGGVSATVIGTRTGIKALLQITANASAPPVEAASSAVRFLFFSSITAVGSSVENPSGFVGCGDGFWPVIEAAETEK